ncbi:MAG: ferritin [candidate division WOR-3 bacterium]
MNKKVELAFNEQIRHELESAYLYQSMVAYFQSAGLEGMAQWMAVQALEELTHAKRFFDHIVERGGRVVLAALAQPKGEWSSALEAFRDAYKHEQFITGRIADLMKLAMAENDLPGQEMLRWFVSEQVEEEASTSRVVQQLELAGTSGGPLLMLDRELGTRQFTGTLIGPQETSTNAPAV